MTPSAIIAGLRANGVRLTIREGVLHACPADRLSPDHRAVIAARKAYLVFELLDPSGTAEQVTLRFLEVALAACQGHLETIGRLERERDMARVAYELQKGLAALALEWAEDNPIPPAIYCVLVSCCHPDRAPNLGAGPGRWSG